MSELDPVFNDLRAIMAPFAESLDTKEDSETQLYLDTRHLQKNKKPLFFGAVQMKKSYVSYHLMPVYLEPALLAGISAELKARMQGKSCFNFTRSETTLFQELATLTRAGYERYEQQGFV